MVNIKDIENAKVKDITNADSRSIDNKVAAKAIAQIQKLINVIKDNVKQVSHVGEAKSFDLKTFNSSTSSKTQDVEAGIGSGALNAPVELSDVENSRSNETVVITKPKRKRKNKGERA